ncbi:hypothetical protein AB0K48_54270, partial [Nonomuraea sp. NPDC055795]
MEITTRVAVPAGGGAAVRGNVREDLARHLASGGDSALHHSPEAALAAILVPPTSIARITGCPRRRP